MPRTTDLGGVVIAAPDAAAAAEVFRAAFGFTGRTASGSRFLRIGAAEIEFRQPPGAPSAIGEFLERRGPGLFALVLEVDALPATVSELRAHGLSPSLEQTTEGRSAAILPASAQTHGVPIVFVERAP
jgi:hypothetical protein